MDSSLQSEISQSTPFASLEEEVYLSLQLTARMALNPWALFLKSNANFTPSQYNVLRILRGAHPGGLTCGEISDRLINRDPDITRLVDRHTKRELVIRQRSADDRRVVRVFITKTGLGSLKRLDEAVTAMPRKLLGHLGKKGLRELNGLLADVRAGMAEFP
jgi:DNA-binding MarR family transcriptional regulator